MRQLRIARQRPDPDPTPAAVAAAAEALRVLLALPLPADLPEFARETFAEDGLRHMVEAAAHLVDNNGDPCADLAAAGHAAGIAAALRWRDDPRQFHRFGWYCIKASIRQQHDLSPQRQAVLARHRAEEAAATLALAALPAPHPWAEAHISTPTELLFLYAHDRENQGLPFVELVLAGHHAVANYAPGPEQDPVEAQYDWKRCAQRAMQAAIKGEKA